MFIGGDQGGAHCSLYPQQNGVVERKNRTLVGAAKAMLFDQGLLLFLWVKAYKTTVYIQNKCPHTTLGRKTPEEVFTCTRPDVSHLRIFGSVCYCHIHADTRKKLDPSGEKGLLVGVKDCAVARPILREDGTLVS